MELVPGGSLLNYLRSSADKLATKALLGNTLDISSSQEGKIKSSICRYVPGCC